jgi:hypothetical protein
VSTERWQAAEPGRRNNALWVALAALLIVGILAVLAMGALGMFGGTVAETEEDTAKGDEGAAPVERPPTMAPGSLRVPRDQGLTDTS